MRQLNARKLQELASKGYGYIEIEFELGLDQKAVDDAIHRIYGGKAEEEVLLRRFKKNTRQNNPQRPRGRKSAARTRVKSPDKPTKDEIITDLAGNPVELAEIKPASPVEQHAQKLRALKASEAQYSDEVQRLESEYQRFHALSLEAHKLADEKGAELKELGLKIKELSDSIYELKRLHDAYANQASDKLSASRSVARELEAIRAEIGELEKLVIYVYKDGEVEYSRPQAKIEHDANWTKIATEVFLEDECRNLRQFEIKTLVNVLMTIGNLEPGVELELVADNRDFKEAFDALLPKFKAA